MNYAQQSNKPEWYEQDDNKLYYCATSGSSQFNEWYEFDTELDAVIYIGETFCTHNMFVFDDVLYYSEDGIYNENFDIVGIKPHAIKNDIQAAIDFESKF